MEWKEVAAPDGSVFYYNARTGISSWEKPNELKSEEEKLSGWSKMRGPEGKIYYYNSIYKKSTWEEPKEFTEAREKIEAINRSKDQSKEFILSNNDFTRKSQQQIIDSKEKPLNYSRMTNDELSKVFKDFLKKNGVTSTWGWEDADRMLGSEEVWKAIKTYNQRKQYFTEYIKECKVKEKEEYRMKKEKLRLNFKMMLEEDPTITSESNYIDYIAKFYQDERWRALDEKEREDQFEDHLDDLERKEEEEKNIIIETKLKNFKQFLYDKRVNWTTRWRDFISTYPLGDISIKEKYEKARVFIEYVDSIYKEEMHLKAKEREEREFMNRENFRELVVKDIKKGIISYKTKWSEYVAKLYKRYKEEKEMVYWNLLGQEGSEPKDIFFDMKNELKEEFRRVKDLFKSIVKVNVIKIPYNISYEGFIQILSKFKEFEMIEEYAKYYLYSYFTKKHKDKDERSGYRTEKKAMKKLRSYLIKKHMISKESLYSEELYEKIRSTGKFDILNKKQIKDVFDEVKQSNNLEESSGESAVNVCKVIKKDLSTIINYEIEKEDGEL